MGLNLSRIMQLFALFTNLPDSELNDWQFLCENNAQKLQNQLKPTVQWEQEEERLSSAAAAFAYADWLLFDQTTLQGSQIKVGDISVSDSLSSNKKQDSLEIRSYFLEQIADLIGTSHLVFEAVGGNS